MVIDIMRLMLVGAGGLASLAGMTGRAGAADDIVEGEVIVTWRSTTTLEGAKTSAGRHAAKLKHHFAWLSDHHHQVMGVVRSGNRTTAAMIKDLQDDPDVLAAEPNYIRHVSALQPNDTYYGNLWGLNNTGQSLNSASGTSGDDIRFAAAWNLARRTSPAEVVVAVIDSGLDASHPDIVGNLWTNSGEIAGNGVDDDGNGYIDDVHGYNFYDDNSDIADSGSHGTHVAGTIAAAGNNALGVIGVAFKSRVMVLKASNDGTGISTSAEISALQYVAMMKSRGVNIVAVNASYGGGFSSTAQSAAIKAAGDVGIVLCAAAGNDGSDNDISPTYPANYELSNIIVVAASDQNDQLAGFSNYGKTTVDVAAPGTNIYSLAPTWLATTTASVTTGATTYAAEGMTYAGVTSGITANAKVLLTWTASSGATGYKVKRSTTNGGPYAQIGSTTTATSYLDTTAGNGTPYYYVVSADNAAGDSANTAQAGATPASPLPPPPGMAVYYSFNDSANLGHDDSGNGQHLRAATGTPQQAASGASGGALYLDGTTTLGTVSGSFPTGVPTGASPYTVACFVKADPASPTGGGWIGYGTNGTTRLSNNFRLNGYGGVWNYWYYVDLGATVPDAGDFRTAWHSVVGTWDGSTRRIYIDGRLAASDTPAAPNIGTTSFIVGRTLNDSNFKGWIDDLLIAGRAWTAGEVTAYHLGAFGPGTASYGSWASNNSASPDPCEDSNHNGVPNGVEYFMGGTAANPAALPPLINTSGTWTWTIPYEPTALASYYFQVSTSLQSWPPLSPGNPAVAVLTRPARIRLTLPSGMRFCRLVVTPRP